MTDAHGVNGWSDAQARVGDVIGSTVGADLVTVSDIRRKLEVIGLDCPLHYDESCARAFGYRTVVSPVSMARVWAVAPGWVPGQPRPGAEPLRTMLPSADPPGQGNTVIATELAIEHHEPVYPGDRVSATAVLRRVTPKTTRVGAGAFMEVETTFVNQRDEVVTVELATVFRFDRAPNTGPAPSEIPATSVGAKLDDGPGFGHVDGVRDHQAVTPGEPLPVVRLPITLQRLVMEAAANRDFSPWHFDHEVASALGAPAAFANTTLIETLLEAAVRRWARLGARIKRLEFAMRGQTCAGEVASIGGRVAGKEVAAEGERRATLALWIDSAGGRTVTASAVVELPAKAAA
jgi:acyl dehydratase